MKKYLKPIKEVNLAVRNMYHYTRNYFLQFYKYIELLMSLLYEYYLLLR